MTKDLRVFDRKPIQITLAMIILITIAGMIYLYRHHQQAPALTGQEEVADPKAYKPFQEIRGFQFNGTHEGKSVITIKADRFSIQKKKVGFFRFGLMNEAVFENVVVHIYGRPVQTPGREPVRSDKISSTASGAEQRITFKDVFSKQSLPALPMKRISGVIMKPVEIVLHDEHAIASRIRAAMGIIRFKTRDAYFKGNVELVSGPRVLTADQLIMDPESAMIKTNGRFVMKTPEKQWEGTALSADIYLRKIASQQGTFDGHNRR